MSNAKIDPRAYAEPCGCGAPSGAECLHSPIRCKHEFDGSDSVKEGDTRECAWCGFKQVATMHWAIIRMAFGAHETWPEGLPRRSGEES